MPQNASNANPNETPHEIIDGSGSAAPPPSRAAGLVAPAVLALVAIALDRATKIAAEQYLLFHTPVSLYDEYLRLVLWYNKGAAFGIQLGGQTMHIVLSLLAMALVVFLIVQTPRNDRLSMWGFGLIIGGALGNLWDRFLRGQVTDFIDIGVGAYRWPTFNLADCFVVLGILFLVLAHFRFSRPKETGEKDDPSGKADAAPIEAVGRSEST